MNQITYHYLVMAQKDLLENQCVEEVLREKSNYYSIRQKHRDFWICISPKFVYNSTILPLLKQTKFYEQKKSILSSSLLENSSETNFFASIISQDKDFLNWIALRLGYFENIDTPAFLEDVKTKNFVSDGIRGSLVLPGKEKGISPLKNYPNYLHPEIFLKKNTKFLQLYYKTVNQTEFNLKEESIKI
jgi:hypothetical protein